MIPPMLYFVGIILSCLALPIYSKHSNVSMDGRSVIIDGKRELLFSGAIHYSRVHPDDWNHTFQLAKEMNLNTIQTYFFWNFHEQERGNYIWDGDRDLLKFFQLAQDNDLYVNFRIGPYVCAEWSYGGFPVWLRDVNASCWRCPDPIFEEEVAKIVKTTVDKVRPYLAQNGGPIIALQIENEYNGNQDYLEWSVDMANNLTTDEQATWILCHDLNQCSTANAHGHHALCTINGFWMDEYKSDPGQPSPAWMAKQVNNNPNQPLVWTEDQAWFDQWGVAKRIRQTEDILYGIARWTAYGGTWHNHYMFTGGSNFGLTAGREVTTGYAPDAVVDPFLLKQQPRFDCFAELYGTLQSVASALLDISEVPSAVVLPSNGSAAGSDLSTVLLACTDTDPSHVGVLDPAQQWKTVSGSDSNSVLLKNVGSGYCLDSKSVQPPLLVACDASVQSQLWAEASIVDPTTHHVGTALATQPCLVPGSSGTCKRCLDMDEDLKLGLWDCKDGSSKEQQNQVFKMTNDNTGIRPTASDDLCLTSLSATSGQIELHQYLDGLAGLSRAHARARESAHSLDEAPQRPTRGAVRDVLHPE